jgi:proteasome lid subunit RPN8/RPN11
LGKFIDNSEVIIKPTAYYKMLIHVLRFGSKAQDPGNFKEVIGMLIGHLEGEEEIKNVIVEDAIPISHGGSIEVKFTEEQLGAFGEIDTKIFEEFGPKNWFTVGWYHSHPNLGIFFSGTDIFNQLFWQDKNPSGIGIVFDHKYLEQPRDPGFRTFRLDDPSKGLNSHYHEVKSIVEPPDSLDYYIHIIDLINKAHSGNPPILELNETTSLFEDIFIPEEEKLISRKPDLDYNTLFDALSNSFLTFLRFSIEPLIKILNAWSQELINKTFYNNSQIRKDLIELKDNLSNGITSLQKSFNYSLQDKLKELDFYIDDKLDTLDEENEKFKSIIEDFNKNLMDEFDNLFEKKFFPFLKQIVGNFEKSDNKLRKIEESYKEILKNYKGNKEILIEFSKIIDPSKTRILSEIENKNKNILENYKKKLKTIEANYNNLDKDLKNILSDLKAAILVLEGTKNPILSKLEKQKNEKKELLNKIKELKKGD